MRLLLRNGVVVTTDGLHEADLLSEAGTVRGLLPRGAPVEADEVVDVSGMLLFPGFIDPHVHSRDPGLTDREDFPHSTRGAAAGGTTTVLEMPNAIPPVMTGGDLVARAKYFAGRAWVDYGLWGLSAGRLNLPAIAGLFAAGAVGVKLFWGYALDATTFQLIYNPTEQKVIPAPDAGAVWQVARAVAQANGLLALHCEDRSILDAGAEVLGHPPDTYAELLAMRPEVAEVAAVAVAAEIALSTGCHVHVVHMSSARALEVLRAVRGAGAPITGETCPHYLTLSTADPAVHEGRVKVYPLIKSPDHQAALWLGIRDGTIESIGSDHAPHTLADKARPLSQQPAGMVGVQTLGPLMVDAMVRGRLSPESLAALLARNPARMYGLYPRKGALTPGSDADIAVVDPNGSTLVSNDTLQAKNPASPWDGQTLRGAVRMTFVRGQLVAADGTPTGTARGQFVPARHLSGEAVAAGVHRP